MQAIAHRAIADLALAQIEGPRQIAVLPRSAAMTGRGRAERVGAQLPSLAGQEIYACGSVRMVEAVFPHFKAQGAEEGMCGV